MRDDVATETSIMIEVIKALNEKAFTRTTRATFMVQALITPDGKIVFRGADGLRKDLIGKRGARVVHGRFDLIVIKAVLNDTQKFLKDSANVAPIYALRAFFDHVTYYRNVGDGFLVPYFSRRVPRAVVTGLVFEGDVEVGDRDAFVIKKGGLTIVLKHHRPEEPLLSVRTENIIRYMRRQIKKTGVTAKF